MREGLLMGIIGIPVFLGIIMGAAAVIYDEYDKFAEIKRREAQERRSRYTRRKER